IRPSPSCPLLPGAAPQWRKINRLEPPTPRHAEQPARSVDCCFKRSSASKLQAKAERAWRSRKHLCVLEYSEGLLVNFPGIAGWQQPGEVARAALRLHIANLHGNRVFVARRIRPGSKHANRSRKPRHLFHMREQEGIRRLRIMLVVDEQIFFCDTVAERHRFEIEAVQPNTFVAVLAEDERLA